MTTEEKYKLAKWAMNYALKKGADQVSVIINNNENSSFEIREEKIDKLEQSSQKNMNIRFFVDQKYSSHSTSRFNKKDLEDFIEKAIEGTRYLSKDEFRKLPEPELYFKGEKKDLQIFDNKLSSVDPQEKIDMAFAAEKEVLGKDERIISVSTNYYDGMSNRVMVTSNGFEGDTGSTYYGISADVSIDGGDARPSEYWSERALYFDKLIKNGVGEKALKRALKKIGQEKIKSGKYDMIVENRSVSRILNPLIRALNGGSIQQKNSFLIDKLNEKIASEKLTVTDDPFIVSGRGSRLFDYEGLAAEKRTIFEKGVLKTYFIDTYYGKKLEMKPTTGSTSNLVFEKGTKNLDDLVASLKKGILVTGFNGGNCNGSTGDFSYGIDGFLIENGKIVKPVSEMNIAGNMKQFWMDLAETGNDAYNSSWLTPSLLFKNVDFSGA